MPNLKGSSWRRRALAAVWALVLSGSVAGCFSGSFGPGIRIWNRTDGLITITYLLQDGRESSLFGEIELAPGMATSETGIVRAYADDRGCVPGRLVAKRDEQVIAVVDKPCEGTTWEVRDPGTSASPAP